RKITTRIVRRKGKSVTVNERNLGDYLGVPKFRFGQTEEKNQIGVAIGLAWTEVGGELLTVEAAMLPGKGKMMSTGKLGEVMKESINAASSYVRSRSAGLGIEPPLFERSDIHVHVPEGATPKDGPSAGVAMATAIVSLMTGIPARRDVAMTGEITLRGRVLPIGGLKEKLLAAGRAGCSKVLIPQENARELAEIRKEITKGLKIIPVQNVDDVLAHALVKPPKPIDWKETAYQPAATAEGSEGAMTTH
ncbi:MAG: endopeptidase La, partial [Hyphomicrobiales bacterium]|nr:endopeptidase La [Hyphomicrobiales bacterium]